MVALMGACVGAQAQQAGDWVVGVGALHYRPQDKGSALRIVSPVDREVAGSGSDVLNTTTLGINLEYYFTDHWGVEGVLGVPPRLKLDGKGSLAGIGQLGSARLYGPAVLLKHHWGEPGDRVRWSAGLGLSYAHFGSARLTPGMQQAMASNLGLPAGAASSSVKIEGKFAPVLNVGMNWALTERLGLGFSVSYIPMRTRATICTRLQATGQEVAVARSGLRLNPVVPYLYLRYRF